MKKKLILIGLASLAFVLLLVSIYSGREHITQSPLENKFLLQNLSCITADSNSNLYMIAESRKSIIKISPAGILQYKLQGEDQAALYLFSDLTVDKQGFLYVLVNDLDPSGVYVESEKVLRYTPRGKLDKVVYTIDYQGKEKPMRTGYIKFLAIDGDRLCLDYVDNERVFLKTLSLDGRELENRIVAYLPAESYLSEISGIKPGAVFYTTQKGQIHLLNSSGMAETVYPQQQPVALEDKTAAQQPGLLPATAEKDRPVDSPLAAEVEKTFPTRLKIGSGQQLYFIDTFANEIRSFIPGQAEKTATVFSQQKLAQQGFDTELTVLKDLVVADDGTLIAATREQVVWVGAEGKVQRILEQGIYPSRDRTMLWLFWLQVLLALALLVFLARIIYVDIMGRKVSLIIKQIIIFSPIIVISMTLLSGMVYNRFAAIDEQEVFRKLEMLTKIGQNRLDAARLESIKSPRDFMNDDYRALRELTIEAQMNTESKGNQRLVEEGLYSAIYKLEEGRLYAIMDYDNSVNMYRPISIAGEFKRVLDSGQVIKDKAMDENGYWMFAMGPLYNSKGEIIGIYETGVDRSGFMESRRELFQQIAQGIALITVVIVLIFVLVTYYFLSSVRDLRKSVGEIASGNWEAAVSIDSGDEVADLGEQFNDMAEHIREYIAEVTGLNKAYSRFVPQQFLNYLGKESVLEVRLGDQVKQEMIILSSQIRSFYRMTEGMSPEDSFNFINAYLKRVGPIIRNYGGIIDKYSASGIVALFTEQADGAAQAALAILKELDDYNRDRRESGYGIVTTGIGIHRGPLMLGIIGEELRLEGTVISANVNIARSLERLSKTFGATILISESTLEAIENPERYQYRALGTVRVEGKDEPVKLYDLFQGDPEALRKVKLETRELFEEGITLYQEGCFYDARRNFIEVIKQNRQDEIARIYFYLCEEYFKSGPPEGWNGTLEI